MSPQRIQRQRTKGWRMPENAAYVGRGTRWGNPFRVVPFRDAVEGVMVWAIEDHVGVSWGTFGPTSHLDNPQVRAQFLAVELFELHTGPMGSYEYSDEALQQMQTQLAGKDLACWCPLTYDNGQPFPCHADVLLRIANQAVTA